MQNYSDVAPFSEEVKFQVGQRVRVQLAEVQAQEIKCDTGFITMIRTRFFASPERRQIVYSIRFDRPYLKAGAVRYEQIQELQVRDDVLKRYEKHERENNETQG